MTGIYNGVQSIIKSENNVSLYTHCGAHRVNLISTNVKSNVHQRIINSWN